MFRFFVVLFLVLGFSVSGAFAQGGRPVDLPRGSAKPVAKVDSRGNTTFVCYEVAGKYQGLCGTFNADGTQKTKQTFANGKQSGPFELFHANGEIKSSCNYVAGKCVGDQFNYFDDGKTLETHYIFDAAGKQHGAQWDYWATGIPRVYAVWNHGEPVNTKVYSEVGALVEEWDGWGTAE